MGMEAASFTGRVIAVLSRRAPAFQPPDAPGSPAGWAHHLQAALDRIHHRNTAGHPPHQAVTGETTGTDSPARTPDPSRLHSGADLRGADLRGANLRGANLNGANLNGAYLRDATLADAGLIEAHLNSADLTGATLADAELCDADLTGAYLTAAHLTATRFHSTNLTDADLSRAFGLEVRWLAGARWSRGTMWPEYLRDRIREGSEEIGAGTYRVRSDESPDHETSPRFPAR